MAAVTPSSRRVLLTVIPVEAGTLKIKHADRQKLKITVHSLQGVDAMLEGAFDVVDSWKSVKFYDVGEDEDPVLLGKLDTNEATFVDWPALVSSVAAFIRDGKERIIVESCQYDGAGKATTTVFFIEPNTQQQPQQSKKKQAKPSSNVASKGSDNIGPSLGERAASRGSRRSAGSVVSRCIFCLC